MKKKKTKVDKSSNIITLIKILGLVLPQILYLIITQHFFPCPNSAFLCLGYLGCFFIGLGLFNLIGLLDGASFGNAVTLFLLGIGGLLIGISSVILYTPSIYGAINEAYVTLWFFVGGVLFILGIWYYFFRMGLARNLRGRGYSKSWISKEMKGYRNYWWYESIHKQADIGWIYFLNKAFTILFPPTFGLLLLLGWWKPFGIATAAATCILCAITTPLAAVTFLFSPDDVKKSDKDAPNPFSALLGVIFPLILLVAIIKYMVTIF